MNDIYENFEVYNWDKKRTILTVFGDMITNMPSNKKDYPIVTELFIRGRKLSISLAYITQSYLAVLENIRLYSTYYLY